ncbi:MAG TPA: hypothetical protein DCS83_08135 [Prevotella sp.]|nr:hypothetical protein [Prevotella sp.]
MIEKLSSKIKSAIRSRSKTVTFTVDEVTELITEINDLLIQKNKLNSRIIELLEEQNTKEINVEAGGF